MIWANLVVLLLLNGVVALGLHRLKDTPLAESGAWFNVVGSGLLLFAMTGAVPFLVLLIARWRRRPGGGAILAHYALTAIVGGALGYGAYIGAQPLP